MSVSVSPPSLSFGDNRLPARFWEKIKQGPGACWTWCAAVTGDGYAKYWLNGNARLGHRVSYETLLGVSLPPDAVLDHICKNRACVSPYHLTPVSARENTARGDSITAQNKAKQFCDKGHPLTGENVYSPPGNPNRRMCRACTRQFKHESYLRNPEPAKRRRDRMRKRRPNYMKQKRREYARRLKRDD